MTKTVVIYHSGYGHTQRVAQFVAEGAKAQVIPIDADGNITDADWTTLDAADAIIFGSPTSLSPWFWQPLFRQVLARAHFSQTIPDHQ